MLLIWMAEMSLLLGMSRAVHMLVSKLLLTQMIEQMGSSLASLLIGKTGLKFGGVLNLLKEVMWGSCTKISSYLLLSS